MTNNTKRTAIIISLCLLAVAWVWLSVIVSEKAKHTGASIFGESGQGLSVFYNLFYDSRPSSIHIAKSAILNSKQLNGVKNLAIFSPLMPISKHESKVIATFVKNGGTLITSFDNDKSQSALVELYEELGEKLVRKDLQDFKNFESITVSTSVNNTLLKSGEFYNFYSREYLSHAECKEGVNAPCFIKETKLEKGKLITIAGTLPFSDALIGKGSNREIAFRLIGLTGITLLDEYHHFFSDKRVMDVILDPTFMLPLVGIVLSLLLYFVAGYNEFTEHTLAQDPPSPNLRFGDIGRALLRRTLKQISAAPRESYEIHGQYLKRLFPSDTRAVQSSVNLAKERQSAAPLIAQHKLLLTARGAKYRE